MLILFTAASFLSATLLFVVQPLFAKMLLPIMGGTPAVWNTCVVFFEVALVVGYLYSHLAVRWLGVRRQAMLHIGVLLLPLAVLPIRIGAGWVMPSTGNPIGWVFLLLAASVGLPFFAVSTSAPLLQRWFGATSHPSAKDPYFLYAASNAGSLLALIAYPTIIEPSLRVSTQSRVWAAGYGLLIALIGGCAWVAARSARTSDTEGTPGDGASPPPAPSVPWKTRLRWLALAAVPSSLMLSTTTYITMDVAAVPLLWVIPLAIYLLTFVLVFAKRQLIPHQLAVTLLPLAVIPTFVVMAHQESAALTTIPALLLTLFVAALVAHGELARLRPPASQLTDFYLTMSIGGALGGFFNVLVAPLVFTSPAEFPIGVVLACLLRPPAGVLEGRAVASSARDRWLDLVLPLMLGVVMVVLKASGEALDLDDSGYWGFAHVYALPLAIWLLFWRRPMRLALGLAALLVFSLSYDSRNDNVIHAERSFFGIYRVRETRLAHQLTNGSTTHGMQLRSGNNRCLPLTYYYPTGPIGQLFDTFDGAHFKSRIAVVGLGTGTMAGYARAGQHWTFYEIDPVAQRLATDDRYFTYVKSCGEDVHILLGDARLTLGKQPAGSHDVIVLDAFTSDSVPVHLLTREAFQLYFRTLAPGGVLVVHISNRFLDLQPTVAAIVRDLGLAGLGMDDGVTLEERGRGKFESQWIAVARSLDDLGDLTKNPRWYTVSAEPGTQAWTDDFSNIISAVKW